MECDLLSCHDTKQLHKNYQKIILKTMPIIKWLNLSISIYEYLFDINFISTASPFRYIIFTFECWIDMMKKDL